MAEPSAEGDSPLDSKGSRELLEAVSFRAFADHGEAGQIVSQKGSSRAQREITSFAGDQPPDEDQLKLGAGPRPTRVVVTEGTSDAGLRHKEEFVLIRGKLGICLGRSGYDRCCVSVSG